MGQTLPPVLPSTGGIFFAGPKQADYHDDSLAAPHRRSYRPRLLLVPSSWSCVFFLAGQHDSQHVRPPTLARGIHDRRAAAEVELRFLPGLPLHPPERQRAIETQTPDEPPHAVVTNLRAGLDQILPNPHGG